MVLLRRVFGRKSRRLDLEELSGNRRLRTVLPVVDCPAINAAIPKIPGDVKLDVRATRRSDRIKELLDRRLVRRFGVFHPPADGLANVLIASLSGRLVREGVEVVIAELGVAEAWVKPVSSNLSAPSSVSCHCFRSPFDL